MQALPTTQQLLDDLARAVRETLMPALAADPALVVNLEMMEQLLTSCAIRAGNEIAWLTAESDAMVGYAREVAGQLGGAAVVASLAAFDTGVSDSLLLVDRARNYHLAGEAFGDALEAAMAAGQHELIEQGRAIIATRVANEERLRPGFYFPGRS